MRRRSDDEARAEMVKAGLEPLEPFAGTNKPWKSRCIGCGNEVAPRLDGVLRGRGGCKFCAWKANGKNARTSEEAARQVMYDAFLEPLDAYPGALKPWRCICMVCNSEVSPRLNGIKNGQGGCVNCGVERGARSRSLRSVGARLGVAVGGSPEDSAVRVMEAFGLTPLGRFPGMNKPWPSICRRCGREVEPRLATVVNGHGCRFCGYERSAEARQLPDNLAIERLGKAGCDPLVSYPGSSHPWKSRCRQCQRIVFPRLGSLGQGQGACVYCAGKKVDSAGAEKLMLKAGIRPLLPFPGSHEPWLSQCDTCGMHITPRFHHISQGVGGCRYCATHGFRFDAQSLLYLVVHTGFSAAKIGICHANSPRIRQHLFQGWSLVSQWHFLRGQDAADIESLVLDWWRQELNLQPALSNKEMPQKGATETVSLVEVDLVGTLELIRSLSDGTGVEVPIDHLS